MIHWDLFQYYKSQASEIGNKKNYSVESFYDKYPNAACATQNLNILTRAYLQDEEAKQLLREDAHMEITLEAAEPFFLTDRKPNHSQKEAILKALNNWISFVQGPPGTGKTEMILNLISCIHGITPTATIAIVSSNRKAIENIEEKIMDVNLTDPLIIEIRNRFASLGNKSKRQAFLSKLRQESRLDERNFVSDEKNCLFNSSLLSEYPIFTSTIHSLRKCFSISENFDNTFDYVIVDECSQVNPMIGLLAMNSAKQLLLVGDQKQLAPVYHAPIMNQINEDFRSRIPELYVENEETSFLQLCEKVFENILGQTYSTLLNEHYRCHPAIAGFCNEYVYSGQLDIKTREDEKLPIQVKWYEGDYCEIIQLNDDEEAGVRKNIYNKMQIRSFMEEEWPKIKQHIVAQDDYSIGILSPYRAQLEILKEKLQEDLEIHGLDPDAVVMEEDDFYDYAVAGEHIAQLTIHKSQGQGFDMVYLMPVEDDAGCPWSQKMRMMNVAVSRAKKALCVFTSSNWFPEELQLTLTGKIVSDNYAARVRQSEDFYLCKFLKYVYEQQQMRVVDDGFGFQKVQGQSIFANTLYYRGINNELELQPDTLSAPEVCVLKALEEDEYIRANYRIIKELPMKEVDYFSCPGKFEQEYEEFLNYSHLDIALCRDDGQLCMVIEVDGACHREMNYIAGGNDRKKDELMSSVDVAYLRLTTDGSETSQMDKILNLLSNWEQQNHAESYYLINEIAHYDKNLNPYKLVKICEEMHSQINDLYKTINNHFLYYGNAVHRGLREVFDIWQASNFRNGNIVDYNNEIACHYYMLKYGMAYAFEYAQMYKLILDNIGETDSFGVVTLGCGSGIDAWSMKYALKKHILELAKKLVQGNEIQNIEELDITEPGLYYCGADLVEWPVKIVNLQDGLAGFNRHIMGADEYFRSRTRFLYNVMFFPRIISELDYTAVNLIANAIRNMEFVRPRVYCCFAHRKQDVAPDLEKSGRILDALNETMCNQGYILDEDFTQTYTEAMDRIREAGTIINSDSMFRYPYGILRFMNEVPSYFEEYFEDGQMPERDNPILRTGYVSWQIACYYLPAE